MPQKNYPVRKKTCCFAPVNLAMKTLKRSNAQFGGYWHFTLDSVPETKAENSNGETLFFRKTTKLATKFWFGNQREDPRLAVTMVIHEHLIQRLKQQTTNVVQFITTRNSKVTVQKKWTMLTARSTWPSIIEEDQATAFGTWRHHSARTRLVNWWKQQHKQLACRGILLTTPFKKRVFLASWMQKSPSITLLN